MIVAFDPIAKEVIIDFEACGPELLVPAGRLHVKYYAEGGTLSALLDDTSAELAFRPLTEEPMTLMLVPSGSLRWEIVFYPQ